MGPFFVFQVLYSILARKRVPVRRTIVDYSSILVLHYFGAVNAGKSQKIM